MFLHGIRVSVDNVINIVHINIETYGHPLIYIYSSHGASLEKDSMYTNLQIYNGKIWKTGWTHAHTPAIV